MRWFYSWAQGVANEGRKPITKEEYRVLAVVGGLVVLSVATLVFIGTRSWIDALLGALFSLHAAVVAGGLSILRWRRGAAWRQARRRKFAILFLSFGAFLAVAYWKPSDSVRLIVITLIVALMATARPSIFGNYPRLPTMTAGQRLRRILASLVVLLVTFAALMQLQYLMHAELAGVIVWVVAIILITRSGVFGDLSDT